MELTRREALAGGALASRAIAVALPHAACGPSLDALANRSGRRFGSAVAGPPGADAGSFANPAYAALLERECELLVPENELKWQWSATAGPLRFPRIGCHRRLRGEPRVQAARPHALLDADQMVPEVAGGDAVRLRHAKSNGC